MDEATTYDLTDAFEGDLNLGAFLGRQQAFGLVSGRSAAAQAMCLREIYEKQLYKKRCPDWDQFCRDHLHMARNTVLRIIRLLNEFGPEYFELWHLTRVTPETYRLIRPALQGNNLAIGGELVPLVPANAARISAAVAEMRQAAKPRLPKPAPAKPSEKERMAALGRQCSEIVAEFESLSGSTRYRSELADLLVSLQTRLDRVQLQI